MLVGIYSFMEHNNYRANFGINFFSEFSAKCYALTMKFSYLDSSLSDGMVRKMEARWRNFSSHPVGYNKPIQYAENISTKMKSKMGMNRSKKLIILFFLWETGSDQIKLSCMRTKQYSCHSANLQPANHHPLPLQIFQITIKTFQHTSSHTLCQCEGSCAAPKWHSTAYFLPKYTR